MICLQTADRTDLYDADSFDLLKSYPTAQDVIHVHEHHLFVGNQIYNPKKSLDEPC